MIILGTGVLALAMLVARAMLWRESIFATAVYIELVCIAPAIFWIVAMRYLSLSSSSEVVIGSTSDLSREDNNAFAAASRA